MQGSPFNNQYSNESVSSFERSTPIYPYYGWIQQQSASLNDEYDKDSELDVVDANDLASAVTSKLWLGLQNESEVRRIYSDFFV